MDPAYGPGPGADRQPVPDTAVPDAVVVVAAAVTSLAAWWASPWLGLLTGLAGVAPVAVTSRAAGRGWPRSWPVVLLLLLALGAAAGWRGQREVAGLAPDRLGPYAGWVRLVDDPQPLGSATRVVVEVEGERFELWRRGRAAQQRTTAWRGGELVMVHGERVALRADRAARVAWQHVVGELRVDWVGDVAPGSPLARASNRVRATIERGAATMPQTRAALFRGLVVGDDRDQPLEMVQRFRASGLSHLTAVSGQNVAFVLAAAGPLLRLLAPGPRWAVTVALIAWFVALTRFEPSIVRAGTMAMLSATAFATGRERAPARLLGLAVAVLVFVDPLLTRAIGFWLSVGATAGVCTVGPWLSGRLARLGPVAGPLGITLGAQAGVVLPSVLVFGRLPLVSVPANLLAVPVAGAVMLYGLPAGLLAGLVPPLAPVLLWPAELGVRWVDLVATVAARLEPGGPWPWIGWGMLLFAVAGVARARRR
jgi:competence protein ComEC